MSSMVLAVGTGRLSGHNSGHRYTSSPPSLLAFIIGFSVPFSFAAVGLLFVGECILTAYALASTLTRRRPWPRALVVMLLFLSVTFSGYFISDLIRGTPLNDVLRGWARIGMLAGNLIGFYYLLNGRAHLLRVYSIGLILGQITLLSAEGRLSTDWKFGAAFPASLAIVVIIPYVRHALAIPMTIVALIAMSIVHWLRDYRSMAVICMGTAIILLTPSVRRAQQHVPGRIGFAFATLLVLLAGVYMYNVTNDVFEVHRTSSNAWRAAGIEASWSAIWQSPLVGHGSWAENDEAQDVYEAVYAERSGSRYTGARTEASSFKGIHSQVLHAWFEAGVLGTVFFLALGVRLWQGIIKCMKRGTRTQMTALISLYLVTSVWHLLASPFAGDQRIYIALSVVLTCTSSVPVRLRRRVPIVRQEIEA